MSCKTLPRLDDDISSAQDSWSGAAAENNFFLLIEDSGEEFKLEIEDGLFLLIQ